MLEAYLDESYNDTFFYVGAAAAPSASWESLGIEITQIRDAAASSYGAPSDAELHAAQIMGGRGEWKNLRGRHREASDILKNVLIAAQKAGVKYMFRGVHIPGLEARYSKPEHPHSVALEHTLQRMEKHCCYKNDKMKVVADTVDLRDELQKQFSGYRENGTRSIWDKGKLTHLQYPIEFLDSRESVGLQVIDIAVYLYRRNVVITEKNPHSKRVMNRLMAIIETSTISGSGTWYPGKLLQPAPKN